MDGLVDTPNRRLLYEKLDINQVVVSSNAILEWLILALKLLLPGPHPAKAGDGQTDQLACVCQIYYL